jgi:hypothetical protein
VHVIQLLDPLLRPGLVPTEVTEKPFKNDCRLLVELEVLEGIGPDMATQVTVKDRKVILPSCIAEEEKFREAETKRKGKSKRR